jgi:hypothetical protein
MTNIDLSLGGLFNLVQQSGWAAAPMMLTYWIIAIFRGDWHTKREYTALAEDRNEWKRLAQNATETARVQNEQIGKLTAIVESLTTSLALQRRQ